MTFAAVGASFGGNAASFSLTPHAVGNIIVLEVSWATSTTTGASSSNANWTVISGPTVTGSRTTIFILGVATSTSTATVSLTTSGAPLFAGQEFSTTAGVANVLVDAIGTLNAVAQTAYPSITPGHGAGELYFGFLQNASAASAGSTSGYTYNANVDGIGDGLCFNPSCTSATQAPTWSDSFAKTGVAILLYEAAAGSSPQINPGPTWLRLFKPGYKEATQLAVWSGVAVETTYPNTLAVALPTLVTNITAEVVHNGPMALVVPPPIISLNTFYENNQSVPGFAPGPTWVDLFKPGLRKPRPVTPWQQITVEFGPLNIVIPPLLTTNITAVQTNPQDVPQINPGPTWLNLFKPGLKPAKPYTTFDLKGESGQLSIPLPTLVTNINANLMNFSDVEVINPGPTWLALFKPGIRKRPTEQDDRVASSITGSLVIILSPGCRSQLESGPIALNIPTLATSINALEQYGRLNLVIPASALTLSLNGIAQQTIHGAFAITLPLPVFTVTLDNGRELCTIQLTVPKMTLSLFAAVVHNGVFNILFMNCGSHVEYPTRYEMFGCESRGDLALEVPRPVLQLQAQLVREKQIPMVGWARAKQTRTARRRQIKGARLAAQERQKLREDDDQDGS